MPKTKEQKRAEAKERALCGQLKFMLRSLYSYTPYGHMYQYLHETEDPEVAKVLTYSGLNLDLYTPVHLLQSMPETRDYMYGMIGVYSVGYFDNEDVYKLITHPKMIAWAYAHDCIGTAVSPNKLILSTIDMMPDSLEVVQAKLKTYFEDFSKWWAPLNAKLKEMNNNVRIHNGT